MSPLLGQSPMGQTESSLLGCAGSEGCMTGWSPRTLRAWHHKPIDSTRVETGQPSFRGRVRCQSLFIAGERRRCEPGSNSVIVTNTLTSVEGHVLRLGGVRRTRKIFVGCPAIRPIWDQSPGIRNPRLETVGNRLYPLHDQDCLRRFTAEAQIQDRSRAKTGPNTAPGFLRVPRRSRALPRHSRKARHSRAGGNPEKNKARHLPLSRRREPREKQSTPPIPHTHTAPFAKRRWPKRPIKAQRPRGMPPVIPAQAGTQRKTKHAIYPFREGVNPGKNKARRQSHTHTPPLSQSEGGPSDRYKPATAGDAPAHSHVPAEAGTQRKTKHAIYPFRGGRNPEKNKARRFPPLRPKIGTQRSGRVEAQPPRRACPDAIREIRGSGKTPPKHNRDA